MNRKVEQRSAICTCQHKGKPHSKKRREYQASAPDDTEQGSGVVWVLEILHSMNREREGTSHWSPGLTYVGIAVEVTWQPRWCRGGLSNEGTTGEDLNLGTL